MASSPNPNYTPPAYEKKSEEPAAASPASEAPPAEASAQSSKAEAMAADAAAEAAAAPKDEGAAVKSEAPPAEASAAEVAAQAADSPKEEAAAPKAEAEAPKSGEEPVFDPPKKAPPPEDSKWKAIFKGMFFGCFIGGGYTALHVELLGKAHLFEGLILGTLFIGPAAAGLLAGQYRSKVVVPYLLFTGACWVLFLYETDSSVWWVDRPQKWEKLKPADLSELEEVVKKWNADDVLADRKALDRKFQLLKDPVAGVITPESLFMYFKMRTSESVESRLLIETVLISLMGASGDQTMTFVEFAKTVVLLYAMAEGNDEARYSACFTVLDQNNNGSISEDELDKWVRFLIRHDFLDEEGKKSWGDSSPEEIVKKYFEKYDQDKDGLISYAEFTRLGPMIHLGAWMKEKGLAKWLLSEHSKKDDSIGRKTTVHVAAI